MPDEIQRRTVNGAVEVAMMHYQPVTIDAKAGEKLYNFTYRNNVAMAWVREEDVPKILAITKECCGGNRRRVFRYCNKQQVNIHMTGDPRKDWNNGSV